MLTPSYTTPLSTHSVSCRRPLPRALYVMLCYVTRGDAEDLPHNKGNFLLGLLRPVTQSVLITPWPCFDPPHIIMEHAALHLSAMGDDSPSSIADFFGEVLGAVARETSQPRSAAAQCALSIFREAAQRALTAEQLEAELRSAGLNEQLSAAAARSWAMHGTAAHCGLSALGARRLIDAEWTFGVTASSSEHAAVGTTYVQLRMVVDGPNGPEYVHTELSLPRFYAFVHDLERAKAQLELI